MTNNPASLAIHESNRIFGRGKVMTLLSVGTGRDVAADYRGIAAPNFATAAAAAAAAVGGGGGGGGDAAHGGDSGSATAARKTTWSESIWNRIQETSLMKSVMTMYTASTDSETIHHTIRELASEAGIHYYRLNPTDKTFGHPLDTTDAELLQQMQDAAKAYMLDEEIQDEIDDLCLNLK